MPRARYDDLLRVARRCAVEAGRRPASHASEVAAGWRAVLVATRRHLAWLRGELSTPDIEVPVGTRSDRQLQSLARVIGVAADLLATQDLGTAEALNDLTELAAARAEVAAIAVIGARAALNALRSARGRERPDVQSLAPHLRRAIGELERLASPGNAEVSGPRALSGLATSAPSPAVDEVSRLAEAAARWQRAYEGIGAGGTLTRDLRSTTAQLRTAGGYALHLADCVSRVGPQLGLENQTRHDLRILIAELRDADAGGLRMAQVWKRRLSDLHGHSTFPGEHAFRDLEPVLRRVVSRDGRLRDASELIPSQRTALAVFDALDELTHATARVARIQQQTVAALIHNGRFFVPRTVIARRDPNYLGRPGAWVRYPQSNWVRTSRPDCFEELTTSLAWIVEHTSEASSAARRLAATTDQSRPFGGQSMTTPPPLIERHRNKRRSVASGIESQSAEPASDRSLELS
jgi:hypothetical protein